MRDPIGLAPPGQARLLAWLPLVVYVLLRGLDGTVLKWLQLQGAAQALNGVNPISFCNIFFIAQLSLGLATLVPGRNHLSRDLGSLAGRDRLLLALHGGLGLFLGPVATVLALDALSVTSQTLLFALVLPLSALLARWLLHESLPRAFWPSLVLVLSGLLLPQAAMAMEGGPMDELVGVTWPLVVSVGLPSTLAALVSALGLYGPQHFLLLRLGWVVGVIGVYGLCLTLGRELALRAASRPGFGAGTGWCGPRWRGQGPQGAIRSDWWAVLPLKTPLEVASFWDCSGPAPLVRPCARPRRWGRG